MKKPYPYVNCKLSRPIWAALKTYRDEVAAREFLNKNISVQKILEALVESALRQRGQTIPVKGEVKA